MKSSIPLSGKFWVEGLETGDRCDVNMHIIRYADVILMYAEALNEVGKSTKALYVKQDTGTCFLVMILETLNLCRRMSFVQLY